MLIIHAERKRKQSKSKWQKIIFTEPEYKKLGKQQRK